MKTAIQATGHGPAMLGHIGSVEDVIAARIPKETTSKRYLATDFAMGFELATPKSLASMGEAVIVNGLCYANSTDRSSKEYDKTISGKEFSTGGIFLIPKSASASHLFQVKDKLSMPDLYSQLYSELSHPLVFAGIFHFSDFHGTAIGTPPINGHNIFTHKQEYYPNPDVYVKNTWGFVIGIITHPSELNEQLKTVLYQNPMDAKTSLVHHAHVLLLKKKIERIEEIEPSIVDRVLHLFIDGTSVLSGKGEIFMVGEVKDYSLKAKKPYEGS